MDGLGNRLKPQRHVLAATGRHHLACNISHRKRTSNPFV